MYNCRFPISCYLNQVPCCTFWLALGKWLTFCIALCCYIPPKREEKKGSGGSSWRHKWWEALQSPRTSVSCCGLFYLFVYSLFLSERSSPVWIILHSVNMFCSFIERQIPPLVPYFGRSSVSACTLSIYLSRPRQMGRNKYFLRLFLRINLVLNQIFLTLTTDFKRFLLSQF